MKLKDIVKQMKAMVKLAQDQNKEIKRLKNIAKEYGRS